jgi:hypothetical protein
VPDDAYVTSEETYLLAAFVAAIPWTPPAQDWAKHLPTPVITVSDCLAKFLPDGQDPLTEPWHHCLQDAIDAARHTPAASETVHVLAVSVPTSAASELVTMIDQWLDDYPHPIRLNLTRGVPTPTGTPQGFEVLGFESGRFHTWLCYGLHDQALDELNIHANSRGLLATLAEAQQVTEMGNTNRGAHDGTPTEVTWFPALITKHNTEQQTPGTAEPTDPPQPRD